VVSVTAPPAEESRETATKEVAQDTLVETPELIMADTTTEATGEDFATEFSFPPLPFGPEPYSHPTGAFTLSVPEGWQLILETATEVAFSDNQHTHLGVEFIKTGLVYDEAQMQDFISSFLEDFMVNFSSYYEVWVQDIQPDGSIYIGLIYNTPTGQGDADFFFTQQDGVIFILSLVTPDYDELGPTWREIITSYTTDAEVVPTDVPVTPATAATSTPTPTPKRPLIPEGKGYIVFTNYTGSDFTVEFVGPGNITQLVPPNGVHEFILDPGHYTLDSHSPGGAHFSKTHEFDIVAGQTLMFNLSGAGMGTTIISQN
jgi:hypothetical protein